MAKIIQSIIATILYIIVSELMATWIIVARKLGIEGCGEYFLLIQGIFQLIIIIGFALLMNRGNINKIWKKTLINWYIIGAILGSVYVVFLSLLRWIYSLVFGTVPFVKYDFDGLIYLGNINIISIVLMIPIAEELFFRGYLQEELQHKLKPWIAILTASVLFALIHAPYADILFDGNNDNWYSFYITFFGGITSGMIYFKSKSIGPSITFHIFWNLIVTII